MKIHAGIAIAATILACSAAQGQTHSASHLKVTEDLLMEMNIKQTLNQSIDIMLQTVIQQNPTLQVYQDVIQEFMAKHMSWEKLKSRYIAMYADEFTEAELKDILAFYRTATGKKLTSLTPTLLRKGSELGQEVIQENLPELQAIVEKRARELGRESE